MRKSPKQGRSRAMIGLILDAAARVLVQDGFGHASTNRIAAKAGVSIGSLYQYFPSKEALVAALIDRHQDEMLTRFAPHIAALADLSVTTAVERVVKVMIEAHAVDPALHKVLQEEVPRSGRLGRLDQLDATVTQLVRGFLASRRREIVPVDLDLAAFVVVTTIEALTHAAVVSHPEWMSPGRGGVLAAEIVRVVLAYLGVEQAVDERASGSPRREAEPRREPRR